MITGKTSDHGRGSPFPTLSCGREWPWLQRTLRGQRMYNLLKTRTGYVQIRDFNGLSPKDLTGEVTITRAFGATHLPEISHDDIDQCIMNISFYLGEDHEERTSC